MSEKRDDERCSLLARQLEEPEDEQRRAFEQYNEVDLGNRLAAEVWEREAATVAMRRRITRTVIEQLIFTVHWQGGTHTQHRLAKPASGSGQITAMKDIENIRKTGVRYGGDEIARVPSELRRTTGKGNRWNEQRAGTVRRRYQIPGQRRKPSNPELLTLGEAAAYCDVSRTTIKRVVEAGVLAKDQIVPWEIKREDVETDPVQAIVGKLNTTGRFDFGGTIRAFNNHYSRHTDTTVRPIIDTINRLQEQVKEIEKVVGMARNTRRTGTYRLRQRCRWLKCTKTLGRSIIVAARKLGTIIWYMLTRNEPFEPVRMAGLAVAQTAHEMRLDAAVVA
jgi:hypothetical protein